MRLIYVFWGIIFSVKLVNAQVTLKINQCFHLTPLTDELYVSGNFNAWALQDTAYKLTRTGFNTFEITINPPIGILVYKFNRGDWASAEATSDGLYLADRTLNYTGTPVTVNLQISGWEDIGGNNTTSAQQNVHLLDLDYFIPTLSRYRKVWIYLPPDYHTSGKQYPVLYMHDGQNLFDNNTSSFGEWEVDESLNILHTLGDYGIIVVGIDNGGVDRINEYSPWVNPSYGGGQGDEYMEFIKQYLKPYIDANFNTYISPEYTGIMGSSMGGLISQFGAIQYQQTFTRAGILSPAFWFSDQIFQQVFDQGVSADMKFYFVSGTTESSSMVPLMVRMKDSLISNGLSPARISLITHSDGQHSEWFWKREFPDAYEWLFSDLNFMVKMEEKVSDQTIKIYPNPSFGHVFVEGTFSTLQIYSLQGVLVQEIQYTQEKTIVSGLSSGLYLIKAINDKGNVDSQKIMIQ